MFPEVISLSQCTRVFQKTSSVHTVLTAFQEHSQEGFGGPHLCFPSRLFLKVIQAVLTEGAPERQRLPPFPSRHHARSGCGPNSHVPAYILGAWDREAHTIWQPN